MISIITVTFNSSSTIEQTIQSVITQTYSNFEYIIVDGASTDGTIDIIKRYAEKDSRIRYVSEPDNGIYDAMNKGINMAKGTLIGLLNSDDFYECDALENVMKQIPNTNKYVVYGMVRILKEEMESQVIISSHNCLPERMMMHPACFVSKAIYDKYKYNTEYKSAADYELFLRLYQDKEIVFIPIYKILTNFRLGGISSSIIGYIEANDIKYKYGYITKKQHDIGNIGLRLKKRILR